MFNIVAIVGLKKAGKTTLISKIVNQLSSWNYRIGVLKHDIHGFQMDYPNTDTYIIRNSGAVEVAISNQDMFAYIRKNEKELDIDEIAMEYFKDIDLLILEGYKTSSYPKIEVVKDEPILSEKDNVIAYVSDKKINTSLPVFHKEEIERISLFLKERFLEKSKEEREVELYVNNKKIPIKSFVSKTLINTIKGLISSLKYCEEPKNILIRIKERG